MHDHAQIAVGPPRSGVGQCACACYSPARVCSLQVCSWLCHGSVVRLLPPRSGELFGSCAMDFLSAEIAKQKSSLGVARRSGKRFMRRAEVAAALEGGGSASASTPSAKRARRGEEGAGSDTAEQVATSELGRAVLSMSEEDVKAALRRYGAPVTLFGETQAKRAARLLVLEQEKGEDTQVAPGYEFSQKQKGHGSAPDADSDEEGGDDDRQGSGSKTATQPMDVERAAHRSDSAFVRAFFKAILRRWEAELDARPEAEKATAAGHAATRDVQQARAFMKPFFKLCKREKVKPSMLQRVLRMVQLCKQQEFVKAEQEYFDLSIGRAAWPMGVTTTGIHSRASRTKLHTDNIAHVMNDERTRKYITSIRRLMTEFERWYPTAPSRMTTHM